jgi:hypothetical protein
MIRWLLAGVLLMMFSGATFALRCNRHVVVEGYRKSKVFGLCGEPDFTEHKIEYQDSSLSSRNRRFGTSLELSHLQQIELDVWTYNFGPHRLMHHLHFKNGKLYRIEVGGYGYR